MTVALLEHPDRERPRPVVAAGHPVRRGAGAGVGVGAGPRRSSALTEITTGYGMTECGGAMTLSLPEDPLEIHSTTVGRIKLAGVAGLPDGDCSSSTARSTR